MTHFIGQRISSVGSWGIAGVLLFVAGACGTGESKNGGAPPGGDGDGTGGRAGDGDGDGTGGRAGDGDGDGTGGRAGDGDGDTGCDWDDEESCVEGQCLPWECEPDADFCSGSEVRVCAEHGLSSTVVETCSESEYCDEASATCQVGVCAPFLPACVTDTSWRVCNADGDGYEVGATQCASTGESCDGGSCKAWVCEPGERFCQGQNVKVCADNGLSSTVQETCENQACIESSGSASCEGECAPDQTQCSDNWMQLCDASGQWVIATACGGTHCDSGECAAPPPSCQGLSPTCGPDGNESCCTSPLVTGGRSTEGTTA